MLELDLAALAAERARLHAKPVLEIGNRYAINLDTQVSRSIDTGFGKLA